MRLKLIIALLFISSLSYGQANYTQVGNTLQQKDTTIAGITNAKAYRTVKGSPGNAYFPERREVLNMNWAISKVTGLQDSLTNKYSKSDAENGFIRNQNSVNQIANFNINGSATVGGLLRMNNTGNSLLDIDAGENVNIVLDRGTEGYDAVIDFENSGNPTWKLGTLENTSSLSIFNRSLNANAISIDTIDNATSIKGNLYMGDKVWPTSTSALSPGRHIINGAHGVGSQTGLIIWNTEATVDSTNQSFLWLSAKSALGVNNQVGGELFGGAENESDGKGYFGIRTTNSVGGSTNRLFINGVGSLKYGTMNWPTASVGQAANRALFGGDGTPVVIGWSESTPAANNESALILGAKTAAGASTFGGVKMYGGIENGTNLAGYLRLTTIAPNGDENEALRINSSQNLILKGQILDAVIPHRSTAPDSIQVLDNGKFSYRTPSELLTDIGAASSSSLSSYLPLSAGISNPLTGILYQTAPSSKFVDVQPSVMTNSVFGYYHNTGNGMYFGVENSTGGNLFLGSTAYAGVMGSESNRAMELATNGTVRYSIDGSGNHDFKSGTATFGGTVSAPTVSATNMAVTDAPSSGNDVVNKTYADLKAPLASPALTGTPTAPTQTANDNSTKIATTAYVDNAVSAIPTILTGTATIDFGTIPGNSESGSSVSVTGAAVGDVVAIGLPYAAADIPPGVVFTAYVSATNQVAIRANNTYTTTSIDPISGTFTVKVFK